ncbi:hypothetical protein LPJ75_003434 [Coemansia sp. RSA 2598]|nr:hypothetical protein LPJ75_003434 [Coemansia sp. RSA 2598]
MSFLSNRSGADTSEPAAERFIDASSRILDKVVGSTGQRAQKASTELVETIANLQSSSDKQLAATKDQVKRTQGNIETCREKLVGSAQHLADCADTQQKALASLRNTMDTSRRVLEEISCMRDPAEEKRARYLGEMDERNRCFESRLRKDHEEFAQMHAQRLARLFKEQL